jgi:hypothetical protein
MAMSEHRDADRAGDDQVAVLHGERRVDRREDAPRERLGALADVRLGEQHHELVAAEARQFRAVDTFLGASAADARGNVDQQLVADMVAEGVVHALDVVEVDEHQRQLAAAGLQGQQSRLERLAQRQPVAETGQRVGVGDAADVALMARNRLRHAREDLGQVADLVVARREIARFRIAPTLDRGCRMRQRADRLQHVMSQRIQAHEAESGEEREPAEQPTHMVGARFRESRLDGPAPDRGGPGAVLHRQAQTHPTDALLAKAHRRADVQQVIGPVGLDRAARRFRRRTAHRRELGHRFTESCDVTAAVVHDPALGIGNEHIHHIGLLAGVAGVLTDPLEVEEIQRIGHRVGQLVGQRGTALLQSVADHVEHEGVAALPHRHEAALLAPDQAGEDQGHGAHAEHHPAEHLGAQGPAEAHSMASRVRRAASDSTSSAAAFSGVTSANRVVPKKRRSAGAAPGSTEACSRTARRRSRTRGSRSARTSSMALGALMLRPTTRSEAARGSRSCSSAKSTSLKAPASTTPFITQVAMLASVLPKT